MPFFAHPDYRSRGARWDSQIGIIIISRGSHTHGISCFLEVVGRVPLCDAGSGLAGAVLVSNPCCLNSSSAALGAPWRVGMLYDYVLARRLRQVAATHT